MIPFNKFLRFPFYRRLIGRIRLIWLVYVKRQLRTIESPDAFPTTVMHNLKGMKDFGGTRMEHIIRPLSAIETLDATSKILTIGPRNEADLLCLTGYGFSLENITGLDLITYSPHIRLGDMHDMPFQENAFDVVICGWTLSYSNNPVKFVEESLRVVKNHGIIAIGVEYSTMQPDEVKKQAGYYIDTPGHERIRATQQIKALYQRHIEHMYFEHDAPAKRSHSIAGLITNPSHIIVIFSVVKY